MENQKNEEGKKEEIKVTSELSETTAEGETIEEFEKNDQQEKRMKNLISAVILLAGVALGSFFVDIVQFINGGGYSERALKGSDIFVAGEKTWVSFEDPVVEVQILSVSDEELESCPGCDASEVVVWLKRFIPTLVAKKVDVESEAGKKLIEKYDLKTVPSFVFSAEVANAEFYQQEASVLFEEKEGDYVLNATGLGIPVGKYLGSPEIGENDQTLGNPEAKVKIFLFSDHQCPFCASYISNVLKVVRELGDQVLLVYKDMPLDFHPQAKNAALVSRCAGEQNRFWEMTELLYANQDVWGKQEGVEVFRQYALRVGVANEQYDQCVAEGKYLPEIEADFEEGRSFGVSGTPSTFINDQFISGVVSEEELREAIDMELNK